jgi:hypothetical protein
MIASLFLEHLINYLNTPAFMALSFHMCDSLSVSLNFIDHRQ